MGFIDHQPSIVIRALGATDYICLAALGTAERSPITMEDVVTAVDALAAPLWVPVFDMVFDTVTDLVERGCLNADLRAETFSLTGIGRRRLMDLLSQPVQAPMSSFGQVGVRLKLAFLHILPPILRRHQIIAIIRAYECEMAARAARCQAWQLNGPMGQRWLDHQMDALEDGLDLLRRLAREAEPKLG